ncbi:MAG: head GIN domain-containing protein [Parvularculaceae bacterium]|nr:head GIN domain-containing protein [Parvularculaceae bacterium]
MKIPAFAAILLAIMAGAAAAQSRSSRTLDLRDFDAIEIGGAYELDVIVGEDFSIELSGPSEEMARVEATIKNGALVLGSKKRLQRGDHKGVSAVVTMPALNRISVSGVADADISGVKAKDFKLDLAGVGEVNIAGGCDSLVVRVSGVGEVDAQSLQCKSVDVKVAGIGEARVYASESVAAEVSGMGSIMVYGSPKSVDKRGGFFSEIKVH